MPFVLGKYILNLKKFNVPVLGWTIDSQAEYDSVKPYFDNFICNTTEIRR